MAQFNFDPNQIISLIQGQQAGNPFPSNVPGIPNQGMGRFQNFMDRASPDQLSGTLGAFQQFAPTWQQGQDWKMRDVFGMGPGRFFRSGYQDFMPQTPPAGGMAGGTTPQASPISAPPATGGLAQTPTPSTGTGGTGMAGAGLTQPGGGLMGATLGTGFGNTTSGTRPGGGK